MNGMRKEGVWEKVMTDGFPLCTVQIEDREKLVDGLLGHGILYFLQLSEHSYSQRYSLPVSGIQTFSFAIESL